MPGCCTDKSCNPDGCMNLPEGETCGKCVFVRHCARMYDVKDEYTQCDFYPRRFISQEAGVR